MKKTILTTLLLSTMYLANAQAFKTESDQIINNIKNNIHLGYKTEINCGDTISTKPIEEPIKTSNTQHIKIGETTKTCENTTTTYELSILPRIGYLSGQKTETTLDKKNKTKTKNITSTNLHGAVQNTKIQIQYNNKGNILTVSEKIEQENSELENLSIKFHYENNKCISVDLEKTIGQQKPIKAQITNEKEINIFLERYNIKL